MIDYEFYETPQTFTRYLFKTVPIRGTIFEPCVGSGAIVKAGADVGGDDQWWMSNDLDRRWPAEWNLDATSNEPWLRATAFAREAFSVSGIDWTVTNPPFTPAIGIIERALQHSNIGVAMHLRASIHEVLKTGPRRTFLSTHTPTGILWLPRFAYQRSKKTGKWTTDSVCACWVIWMREPQGQFIRYAPEWVLDALESETPAYRTRMDAVMGYTGSERERQAQRKAA